MIGQMPITYAIAIISGLLALVTVVIVLGLIMESLYVRRTRGDKGAKTALAADPLSHGKASTDIDT
jgi:hypothetical protein